MTVTVNISVTSDTPADALAALASIVAASGGGTGNATSGTGGTTGTGSGGIPASSNVYPLMMPSNVAAGAPVGLGTGPTPIVIYASSIIDKSVTNEFAVLGYFNGSTTPVAITGPLACTSYGGMGQSTAQVFTINGDFTGLTSLELAPAGPGVSGMWVPELTVDYAPWWVNTDAINSRGTGTPVYGTLAFDSNGAAMIWLPQSAIPAVPVAAPAATPSTITGAIIGTDVSAVGQAPATLAALVAATPAGATLTLPAGTFVGAAAIGTACTISGAGMGKTIIDGTGISPDQDKALLVAGVSGTKISNMTLQNASISAALGNNAAGARQGGPGIDLTLDTVEVTGCQDGLLTFAGTVTLSNGHTHDNGAGDGFTHEIYLGGDTSNVATLTNWISTCGMKSTHALKSRAGTTSVSGGVYTGSPDTTGNVGGSVIDIPDGGICNVSNATIVLATGAANHNFLTFGLEGVANLPIGDTVTLTGVVFQDNTGTGGAIAASAANFPAAKLVLSGCTYLGAVAPAITGWASVTGTIAKAA